MNSFFQVKICGITNVADAHAALDAGADAIGLNFYEASPRFVAADVARKIVESVGQRLVVVGVFVNAEARTIREAVDTVPLHAIQLHGDEPPELIGQLHGIPAIRAIRLRDDFSSVASYLAQCRQLHAEPRAVLIDAWHAQAFGGTGTRADWALINANRAVISPLPLVLAGGLSPDNVAAAIEAVRPEAVDTASGVEITPSQKSVEKMTAFVTAARRAFAGLPSNG